MKLTRTIAIAVIASAATWGLSGLSISAKTLREAEFPAEFPPASFNGKQYVDSRGCVYIRAGIDGVTNWVPRVTRSREVLCGFQPTFAKATTAPAVSAPANVPVIAPAPAAKPAVAPVTAPPAKPAEPVKIAPKPAPRKVVQAAPKPAPAAAPQPRRVVTAAPQPVTKPVVIGSTATVAQPVATAPRPSVSGAKPGPRPTELTSCANVTGISRYYAGVSKPGLPVRCGPQGSLDVSRETVTVMRAGKPVQVQRRVIAPQAPVQVQTVTAAPAGQVRVVPRHVWEQQQAAKLNAPIPEGYRPVWKDDRLNRKRAHQTPAGIAATDLQWTRTVPRQLFIRSTGEVVTQLYPGLIYPYYSYDEMQAAGYTVPDTGVLTDPSPRTVRTVQAQAKKKRAALVSTKSVAAAPVAPVKVQRQVQAKAQPKVQASGKGRYVQVGLYGVEANARNTAARLGSLGLPARLATLTKGGKSYRIVLAGPFAPDQIGAALSRARGAGFHDAFVR
ncbi:MAG: SPOR domain-containing protein [Paracoccaceae bacterium]